MYYCVCIATTSYDATMVSISLVHLRGQENVGNFDWVCRSVGSGWGFQYPISFLPLPGGPTRGQTGHLQGFSNWDLLNFK